MPPRKSYSVAPQVDFEDDEETGLEGMTLQERWLEHISHSPIMAILGESGRKRELLMACVLLGAISTMSIAKALPNWVAPAHPQGHIVVSTDNLTLPQYAPAVQLKDFDALEEERRQARMRQLF
jgi:hypothetical protein